MVLQRTRRGVRVEERVGTKKRYWDPRDGTWTGPLGGSASEQLFYQRKGYLQTPPGDLAIYANPALLESTNPDPAQRELEKASAFMGPFPTGEKTTLCRCPSNCETWEAHYERKNLRVHHLVKDEMSAAAAAFSDDDIAALVERLADQGYRLVKEEPDGDNDNSEEESGAERA